MNSRHVLQRALRLVEVGWTKGNMKRDGCFCSVGAIAKASGSFKHAWEEEKLPAHAQRALARLGSVVRSAYQKKNTTWGHVVSWNDNPRRTKRQVINAFKRALKVRA